MNSFLKAALYYFLFSLLIFVLGCKEKTETPTKGNLKAFVDESIFKLVQQEKDTFVALYPNTKIDLEKTTAREGIAKLLNNETELFISSRGLNEEELLFIKDKKLEIKVFKFCIDAVSVIVNKNDKMVNLRVDELKDILSGKNLNYKIVIPQKNSGIYEYVKNSLLQNKEPKNVQVVKSEDDVLSVIEKSDKKIGLLGLNLIQDSSKIKIIRISNSEIEETGISFYEPHQAYLVNGNYPLNRTAYLLLNEIGYGVASGFTTFLTSFEGQKIVKLNKLGPATVPIKLVKQNR